MSMSRSKRFYPCGQKRGGTPGSATATTCPEGRNRKHYGRQAIAFHGGDMAYEAWVKGGRKGYGR